MRPTTALTCVLALTLLSCAELPADEPAPVRRSATGKALPDGVAAATFRVW